MNISGSTVLITGASGGIGGAIARELAWRGASLILVNRDGDRLERLATELRGSGGKVLALTGDIAQPGMPAHLIEQALEQAGAIDILINCAGVQNFGFFAQERAADTAMLFQVNTIAPIALVNAVLPHMLARGTGKIVNVGSIFGSIGFPCFASYSASKFALRGFSEALRRELAGTGVGVTYVAPRFTKTAFNRNVVARMASALKMNQDEPESVAASVIATIERDDRERYLGWPEKLFVRLNSVLPRLVDPSLIKQVDLMRPFATEATR
ncbi:SDR family oxidoreductase [Thiobacillus sp.]|uniref:SDR family oxidoreductase n=1 Tax=Thiobacillus sp. TaxID=924 RepID=UPI0011D9FF10|nr:SDR family oxidoreductase [Thiobacillus sp.]MBC2730797.1 SDR family oxidoreductase [Thiobacillus sp.]MBC2739534.1 SDR family oxidoreductase [Thiobacillus sp.]MBC2760182.1 SDR family oxidoreductase [Thiobacillus sp.]TXH76443.1 MAG: SDR family oxidoreductase [Thiobacillus sp.]